MIRIAAEADVPEMLAIYAPYILTTTYTFEYAVPSEDEFLQRFRTITAQFPWLVWEEDGQILGYAYGSAPFERAAYRWCAEPSIYLSPGARGRGIGSQLYHALEGILKYQGYATLYALITAENTDSVAFHTKNGYHFLVEMKDCGFKFGRWVGVVWMEKRLTTCTLPDSAPTPWSTLVKNTRNFSEILDKIALP